MQTFLKNFNRLEAPVRQHLKNVYGALSLAWASACVGVNVFETILATLAACILLCMLLITPAGRRQKNATKRLGYLLGFGLTSGMGLVPLMAYVHEVDPAIIVTALLGSTLVFVCFSTAALLAERGSWLFFGGTLIASMTVMSLVNSNMQWRFLYQADLYASLVVPSGFVFYDTQLIVEKRRAGDKDFVLHALDLFMDFIHILVFFIFHTNGKLQKSSSMKNSEHKSVYNRYLDPKLAKVTALQELNSIMKPFENSIVTFDELPIGVVT